MYVIIYECTIYLSCHVNDSCEDGQTVSEGGVVSAPVKECLFGDGFFFSQTLSSTNETINGIHMGALFSSISYISLCISSSNVLAKAFHSKWTTMSL